MNFGYEHTVPTSTVLSTSDACRVASITWVPISRLDEIEPGGVLEVVADATDVGGEVDDDGGLVGREHCFGGTWAA